MQSSLSEIKRIFWLCGIKLLQCLSMSWIITLQTGDPTHALNGKNKTKLEKFWVREVVQNETFYTARVKKISKLCKKQIQKPKFMIIGHCDIQYEKKAKLSNLMDVQRKEYHEKHLQSIHQAIKEDGGWCSGRWILCMIIT